MEYILVGAHAQSTLSNLPDKIIHVCHSFAETAIQVLLGEFLAPGMVCASRINGTRANWNFFLMDGGEWYGVCRRCDHRYSHESHTN